jgi:catechol 2,3-dioxygenase-like lactoylglutathione lyase family enzyme
MSENSLFHTLHHVCIVVRNMDASVAYFRSCNLVA